MSCFSIFCGPLLAGRESTKDGAFVGLIDNADPNHQKQTFDSAATCITTPPSSPDSPRQSPKQQQQRQGRPQSRDEIMREESRQADMEAKANQNIPWVWSRTFHQTYQLGPQLGQGAHAVVHEALQLGTNDCFAIKIIERQRLCRKQLVAFKNEVQILANLQHPNILKLVELYKDPRYFFVVLEKLNGGELFDRLCQKQTYSEADARDLCRTIFQAVAYCHKHKIVHRDLKPENLLLKHAVPVAAPPQMNNNNDNTNSQGPPNKQQTSSSHSLESTTSTFSNTSTPSFSPSMISHAHSLCCNDTDVKIADFGFAKRVWKPESLTTRCGSPAYTAPEIINYLPYDERVDNWSLGVILFTILGGYPPFYGFTIKETFQQIRTGAYVLLPERWDGISPDAKRLVKGLLTIDMHKRLTIHQALEHPWMTGRGDDLLKRTCLKGNLEHLKTFNHQRKTDRVLQAGPVKSTSYYWLVSRR